MAEDKRERIMEAAVNNFKHFGFGKTSVDDIARQAQVGKGTIYSYFRSKEEILIALVDREFAAGLTAIDRAMKEEPSSVGKLRILLVKTVEHFHKNELVGKVMAMDTALVLSVISKKNKELQMLSIAGLKDLLEQGVREGVFRKLDFDRIAYSIDALIRSFHYLNYLGLDEYDPNDLVQPVFDLLLEGIRRR